MALACGAGAATAETITINNAKRTFSARLADMKPAPLVIVLHGNTQTGADMASRTSWPAVAKREHFTVVFPDGLNRAWADARPAEMRAGRTPPAGTDDVAFIVKLVD
jgi:polyhydroxybutyrate depolymerase